MTRSTIRQSIVFSATPQALYAMYLDPAEHAKITGAPVTVSADAGAPFHAFNGVLRGTMLAVVPSTLIVQSWRSSPFRVDDPDSTLILSFSPHGDQGRIDLVHLDVPDHDYRGVTEGWETYYWAPWRRYLAARDDAV